MAEYYFAGRTNIGYSRTVNEDYMDIVQLDDGVIFAVVADGMGSRPSELQPANIVCTEITSAVKDMYEANPKLLLENAEAFLKIALLNSNRVIGAFKRANEELYAGFGTTLTCCLLDNDYNFTLVHTGNSRLYLIRNRKGKVDMRQLTTDHTVARELLTNKKIGDEEYYSHPDRLKLTSAIGFTIEPIIQTMTAPVKVGDVLLMSTDGIHYAVRPEPMLDIILQANGCEAAADGLIQGAKITEYADNMTAAVIFVQ